jgi:hypothetical protein
MIYLINKQNFRTEGILEKRGVCADQCPWNPLPIYRTPATAALQVWLKMKGNEIQ